MNEGLRENKVEEDNAADRVTWVKPEKEDPLVSEVSVVPEEGLGRPLTEISPN